MTAVAAPSPSYCITQVLFRPQIAPDIAKLTGLKIGTVCATLLEMEKDGKVRRTGESRCGWNGEGFEVWERVLP